MALLTAITHVLDSAGQRVDRLLQTAGGYLPIALKLGTGIAATAARNGQAVEVTLTADPSAAVTFAAVEAALAAASSSVDFNSKELTGIADPTSAQSAATKAWVEAYMGKYLPRIEVVGGQTVEWSALLYLSTVAVGLDSVTFFPAGIQAAKADHWQVGISRFRGGTPTTLVPLTNLNTGSTAWSAPTNFAGLGESSLPGDAILIYYVPSGGGVDPLIPHSVVWTPA